MREWCQGRRLAAELESELGIPDLGPYTYQPTICSCLDKIALIQIHLLNTNTQIQVHLPTNQPTYQPTICGCLDKIALIHSNFSNYPFNVKIFAFDSLILILEFHIPSTPLAFCLIFAPVHVHFILPNSVQMLQG